LPRRIMVKQSPDDIMMINEKDTHVGVFVPNTIKIQPERGYCWLRAISWMVAADGRAKA
jgi:hypothetical protein